MIFLNGVCQVAIVSSHQDMGKLNFVYCGATHIITGQW